jgi:hypothetical protein
MIRTVQDCSDDMESLGSIVDFCSGFYSQKALMRRVEAENQTKYK